MFACDGCIFWGLLACDGLRWLLAMLACNGCSLLALVARDARLRWLPAMVVVRLRCLLVMLACVGCNSFARVACLGFGVRVQGFRVWAPLRGDILGYLGISWDIMGYPGISWDILG